jgi:hypothetical protein
MTTKNPNWPPHWRTDAKEIVAQLEMGGWRVYRRSNNPRGGKQRNWYDARREGYDLFLAHRFRAITPGARHALDEVVMGRPAPRREGAGA